MSEIVAVLRDPARVMEITNCAYHEVALHPHNSFAAFVARTDQEIVDAFTPEMATSKPPYECGELNRAFLDLGTLRKRARRRFFTFVYHMLFRVALGSVSVELRDRIHARLRQILYPAILVKRQLVGRGTP